MLIDQINQCQSQPQLAAVGVSTVFHAVSRLTPFYSPHYVHRQDTSGISTLPSRSLEPITFPISRLNVPSPKLRALLHSKSYSILETPIEVVRPGIVFRLLRHGCRDGGAFAVPHSGNQSSESAAIIFHVRIRVLLRE